MVKIEKIEKSWKRESERGCELGWNGRGIQKKKGRASVEWIRDKLYKRFRDMDWKKTRRRKNDLTDHWCKSSWKKASDSNKGIKFKQKISLSFDFLFFWEFIWIWKEFSPVVLKKKEKKKEERREREREGENVTWDKGVENPAWDICVFSFFKNWSCKNYWEKEWEKRERKDGTRSDDNLTSKKRCSNPSTKNINCKLPLKIFLLLLTWKDRIFSFHPLFCNRGHQHCSLSLFSSQTTKKKNETK